MKLCLDCKTKIKGFHAKRCRSCAAKLRMSGSNNPNWRGGVRLCRGRARIWDPDNPMAMADGAVMRARLVMADKVGRPLESGELVHHINGDPLDDCPENLRIETRESHNELHKRAH